MDLAEVSWFLVIIPLLHGVLTGQDHLFGPNIGWLSQQMTHPFLSQAHPWGGSPCQSVHPWVLSLSPWCAVECPSPMALQISLLLFVTCPVQNLRAVCLVPCFVPLVGLYAVIYLKSDPGHCVCT